MWLNAKQAFGASLKRPNSNPHFSALQPDRRAGKTDSWVIAAVVSLVAMLGLGAMLLQVRPDLKQPDQNRIRIYCASGVAKPIEELIEKYHAQQLSGRQLEIVRTGGSGELAGQIQTEFQSSITNGAEVFVSADHKLLSNLLSAPKPQQDDLSSIRPGNLKDAPGAGCLIYDSILASQQPVIVVRSDSDLIENRSMENRLSLREIVNDKKLRLGIASERAAIGFVTRQIARKSDCLETMLTNRKIECENVMVLGQALLMGSIDVAVLWDTTVAQFNSDEDSRFPRLKIIGTADPNQSILGTIGIAVVKTTDTPDDCEAFVDFVSARENQTVFEAFGFTSELKAELATDEPGSR